LIRQKASRVIAGNHDVKVISAKKIAAIVEQKKELYKVFIFKWTHQVLAAEAAEYLRTLDEELRVTVDGHKVLLVHGSPEGMSDGLTVFTSQSKLAAMAGSSGADLILAGHTHEAFSREVNGVVVANPGSAGRPFDGDPGASFMMLDFTAEGVEIRTHRVAYDTAAVVDEMRRQGFLDILIRAFILARSPADVLPDGVGGDLMEQAQLFGAREGYEKAHALQVAKTALQLFDQLAALHGYGLHGRERAMLQAAALLHDIGLSGGLDGHHKASRDMILADRTLALADRERHVVALIARYHRKAMPGREHEGFARLPDPHQVMVERLGGILRLADGLDRSHQALVRDVTCEVAADAVTMMLAAEDNIDLEIEYGKLKSDLFERAFGKNVILCKTMKNISSAST
jgi:exopolyphosphatase/guanosine-5'-triphosphate,3'-diphosphate pyrophosphatase